MTHEQTSILKPLFDEIPIRIGDKFIRGNEVWEVTGTKPGGKIELFCKEKSWSLDSWHRIVKTWSRAIIAKARGL